MMQDMVASSLISVGVTRTDAVLAAMMAVVCLILLCVFIILGIDAFAGANNVSATLQSLIIFGVSRQVSNLRKQAASEANTVYKANKDDKLVETIVQRQKTLSGKL